MQQAPDPDSDELTETHDINVTPFIDVILVLLIIFMVAAPLATVDVPVDLPSAATSSQPRPDKPVYVTLQPDLTVTVGDVAVTQESLAAALEAATSGDHEVRIFLRADRTVRYDNLMDMLNTLRTAGFVRVALVALEKVQ